jgi:tetratricopeptide (TPR) repeat protein
MAMEFIEGTSLQERLRSGQAFTLDEVVDVVSQIGAALDYAHQRGFIHRDIKPANILIESSGRAVLTDFGIVKALSESGVTSALTQAGTIIGTPQYMSPEQVKDEPLDHRSDLYSLGIVCFEMLSGQVPFDGTTTHAILYAQVNTPPPPLRKFSGLEVPAPVEAAVNKMLAKDLASRYNSAGEFARDLAQAVAGVWPAGIGGETAVVGHMGSGTAVAGGAAGGVTVPATKQPAGPPTPPPTVRQPGGPPTPVPAVWQPVGPPTPTPVPARRGRSPLALELGIAAGIVLILGIVVAALLLGRWYPLWNAQRALRAGDYARAVEGFSQTLERNPDNAQAIEGLLDTATNLSQDKQFDAAIAAYETVERVKPQEVRALQGLGRAYEAKGAWGEAAAWYEKWTQVATEDKSAFLVLSNARLNLREYERAVAAYERAKALGAGSTGMDTHLGLAYFELAQYDKAVEHLQPAVEQNPEDFELQRALGLSLYSLDQPEQAMEHLNKAVALGADRSGAELADMYYALGGCHFALQDYGQAIRFCEQAQALEPEGRSVWAGEAQANLDEAYSRLAPIVVKSALLDLDFSNVVSEGGETYAIARTGQRVEIDGPVRLVDGPWEGSQALVVEEGTTNEFVDPALDGTGNWSAGGTTPPVVTEQSTEVPPYVGRYTAKAEFPAGGDTGYQGCRVTARVLEVPAGQTETFSVWIMADDVSEVGKLQAYVTGSYGQGEGNSNSLDNWAEKAGQWYRWYLTFTNNSDGSWNEYITIYVGQPLANNLTLYLDGMQYEAKAYPTTLCYGDAGGGYQWGGDGTPHASPSTRQATQCESDAAGSFDYSSDHTVLVWMKLLHESGTGPLYPAVFHYGQYYTDNSIALMFYQGSGLLGLYAKSNAGVWDGRNAISNPAQPIDGYEADVWYMVGYRYDQSENRVDLVWDGQVDEQGTGMAWPSADNAYHRLGIGCRPDGGESMAGSAIATVAIFSRALSATELSALYRTGAFAGK